MLLRNVESFIFFTATHEVTEVCHEGGGVAIHPRGLIGAAAAFGTSQHLQQPRKIQKPDPRKTELPQRLGIKWLLSASIMSGAVSLKELLNLAIGSPKLGAVNFNILRSLLYGLLVHLQVGDVRRKLSPKEWEFIQPGPVNVMASDGTPGLFHLLQDKVSRMEARLQQLDSLPSPNNLLQGQPIRKQARRRHVATPARRWRAMKTELSRQSQACI
ncbi:uncharacterized protein [Hyperolius riggenbachi]|uniref:uncharacterized protein isoform X2 n=1 Tax=Hyperolius riggenbachi TaxID=752182 RepID=UPI0035A28929